MEIVREILRKSELVGLVNCGVNPNYYLKKNNFEICLHNQYHEI